ncbi:M20 metallopeptidase family protein [Tetragenococcus muriaticus]|uniref:N-acetyl-L,L-diaminopimelate deacetylase n=2 Tax=Tetragenococcus muriaticus TaxID=64642 RepID=A0A091CDJ9_9ENTE|nr:M20 family metallopeptidase [Tetragenococcus muriaticus]KFN92213.1 N-acetyl-L,L-diaminopimelate deacetylase [Tetragenococcus muriaticus 3MR10-3]KFN92956.1 N-acetyl-L,L-diaminopimelate deacetylase [Tetragenococcus muriaticus PMC-11-5]GMA47736.1 peptidase [Tetragenococcus muriaticus]
MQIKEEVQDLLTDVTSYRRQLHQIPELGLEEKKSAEFIREKLRSFGITEIYTMLTTATIAVFHGKQAGKTLAFRSDIDALPVTEETGVSFASKTEGKMHACGHDGHASALLGFAKYLSQHPEVIKGTIVLIFQPAEEGPGGAQLLINEGLTEKFGIDQIVGIHLFPEFPEGVIACRPGAMMARNGEVTIKIKGKSAHGAQPHQGQDAILAASAVIQGLHSIISRNISPLDTGVLTFGEITGGQAMNIIAGEVKIEGTMRAFSDEAYDIMTQRVKELAEFIAQGYGCQAEVSFNHMYRVVDNDAKMVQALEEVAGKNYVECQPYMLAEDFSMYQQVVPGLFFFVGIRNEEKGYTYPLHSGKMQFDEKNLLLAVTCYVQLIETLNKEVDR